MGNHEEKIYFQDDDVLVSDKRVILTDKTYALKQITSVGRIEVKGGGPIEDHLNIRPPKWLIAKLGAGTFFCLCFSSIPNILGSLFWVATWGIVFCLVGTVIKYEVLRRRAADSVIYHWVEIGSASGKEKALLCNTQEEAQEITDAINDAIIDN